MNTEMLAKKHNGIVSWPFNQDRKEVTEYADDGLCAALTVSWIKYHCHNDSLVNHLSSKMPQAGSSVSLNPCELFHIAQIQRIHNAEVTDADSDENDYKPFPLLWLEMFGINPLRRSMCVNGRPESLLRKVERDTEGGIGTESQGDNIEFEITSILATLYSW